MDIDCAVRDSKIYKRFNSLLTNNKLSHAIIIQAEDNFSAEFFADYFAKMILCENKTNCLICSSCKKTNAGTHADLVKIGANKSILVEDITRVTDDVFVKPIESENKVYVLCGFDEASEVCQNKLLKTLEEPPKNIYLFLCVKNINSVLQTIVSRSSLFVVDKFNENVLLNIVKDKSENINDAVLISELSNNSIGQALFNVSNKNFCGTVNLAYEIIDKCKKSSDILDYSYKILQNKQEILSLFDMIQFVLNEIISYKSNGQNEIKCKKYLSVVESVESEFSIEAIIKITNEINLAKNKMQFNCNINSVVDIFLLKFLEEKHKWK